MTAFKIDGGLGRVICSLAPLQKNGGLAIVHGWKDCFIGSDVMAIEHDSLYLDYAVANHDIATPEPYHLVKYRTGEWNMVEAFDYLINGKVTMSMPTLTSNPHIVYGMRSQLLDTCGGKIISIHPFGTDTTTHGDGQRDITDKHLLQLIKEVNALDLKPLIIGDDKERIDVFCEYCNNVEAEVIACIPKSLQEYFALIESSDYFIGCDSSGMHIAAAYGVQGAIVFGGTADKKYYPEHFFEFKPKNVIKTDSSPRMGSIHNMSFVKPKNTMEYRLDLQSFRVHIKTCLSLL